MTSFIRTDIAIVCAKRKILQENSTCNSQIEKIVILPILGLSDMKGIISKKIRLRRYFRFGRHRIIFFNLNSSIKVDKSTG